MKIHIVLPSSPWLADSKTNIPLGPLYIAASLEAAGHEVVVTSLLDRHGEHLTLPSSVLDAPLHMISACTPQFNEALEIAAYIKDRQPWATLVLGGAHATYEPTEAKHATRQLHYHVRGVLPHRRDYELPGEPPLFDSVVVSEGELIVHELVADFQRRQLAPFYDGRLAVPDVNAIAYPAWHLLPPDHIHNDGVAVMKHPYHPGGVMSLMGTRGCPFKCRFCSGPNIGQKPRYRTPANIVGEMRRVVEMGVRMFKFQDDTYTANRRQVHALANLIESEFGDGVACRVHTRVNTFDDDLAKALKQMQAKVVCFGIESGAQQVLGANLKRTTVEQNSQAVRLSKAHGFYTVAFLVFGLAGETEETAHETMDWLAAHRKDIDSCNLAVAIPYPGSAYWADPAASGITICDYNYDNQWIVGFAAREELLVLPEGVSRDKMLHLKREMFDFLVSEGWAKPEWRDDARIAASTQPA